MTKQKDEPIFWPGTNIRKSTGNAFTHPYRPDAPIVSAPVKPPHSRGGFGANNGTIQGLGPAKSKETHRPAHLTRPSTGLTIKRRA